MEEQQEQAGGGVGMLEDRNPPLRWPDLVIMHYTSKRAVAIRTSTEVHGVLWGANVLDKLMRLGHFTLEWTEGGLDLDLTRSNVPFCYIADDRRLVGVGKTTEEFLAPEWVTLRFPAAGDDLATTLVQAADTCEGLVWSDDALQRLHDAGIGEPQWTANPPEFVQIFSTAPGCYYDNMGNLICYPKNR